MSGQHQEGPSVRRVVILVHGIRTFGAWQDRLATILHLEEPGTSVHIYKYGYFSALAFVVPFLRTMVIRRFRDYVASNADDWRGARIDIVAHSFGTYVVAWGLRGLPAGHNLRIRTVILCGSVLKQLFPWGKLVGARGFVDLVVNECGTKDVWPVIAQLFVFGMGIGGRQGFAGVTGRDVGVVNRFHDAGHSGFFSDEFMRRQWLPFMRIDTSNEALDAVPPTPGWSAALEYYADPIKLLLLLAPFIAAFMVWQSYRVELVKKEVERKEAEAARDAEESRRIAAQAREILYREPLRSYALARRAMEIQRSPEAVSVRDAARDVLEQRRMVEEQDERLRYVGWSWFNPTFSSADLPAVFSPDGRHVLLTTNRATDGSDNPAGEAFRLSSMTQKLTELEPVAHQQTIGRITFAGWNNSGQHAVVARCINKLTPYVEVHALDSSSAPATVAGFRTKGEIAHVDGVQQGNHQYLVVGDADGAVWVAQETDGSWELRQEEIVHGRKDQRRILARVQQDTSGAPVRYALLVFATYAVDSRSNETQPPAGEARIWRIGKQGPESCVEVPHGGSIRYAVFDQDHQGRSLLMTVGTDGFVKLWEPSAARGAAPSEVASFDFRERSIGFAMFIDDGKQILVLPDDGEPIVLDTNL